MSSVEARRKVAAATFNRRNAEVLADPEQAYGPMHAARIALRVSQSALGAEVGLSTETIRRVERGRPTSYGSRVLIANALGIPLADVPGRVRAKPPKIKPQKPAAPPNPEIASLKRQWAEIQAQR